MSSPAAVEALVRCPQLHPTRVFASVTGRVSGPSPEAAIDNLGRQLNNNKERSV